MKQSTSIYKAAGGWMHWQKWHIDIKTLQKKWLHLFLSFVPYRILSALILDCCLFSYHQSVTGSFKSSLFYCFTHCPVFYILFTLLFLLYDGSMKKKRLLHMQKCNVIHWPEKDNKEQWVDTQFFRLFCKEGRIIFPGLEILSVSYNILQYWRNKHEQGM